MQSFVPEELRLEIDAARQVSAREYARQRLFARGAGMVLSLALLALAGPGGAAVAIRDRIGDFTDAWAVQVLCFFLILGTVAAVLELPLTFWRGFVLPHRYGMSNQSLGVWVADLAKGGILAASLGLVSMEALYGFLHWTADAWWIWTGLAFCIFAVVLASVAPVLILPLFFHLTPLTDETLSRDILDLARRAGTAVGQVCQIDLSSKSPAANAAVIGLGRTRKIVLGDTLLSSFPPSEVQVVVAHELGHHVHRDLPKGLALETVLTIVGLFLASLALKAGVSMWHFANVSDLGLFPLLAAVLGVWSALSGVVSRAQSRRAERQADDFSLRLTGLAVAYINSEVRLTNQNLGWFDPPRWLEVLLYTHPAPWRRVAMGDGYLAAANQPTLE